MKINILPALLLPLLVSCSLQLNSSAIAASISFDKPWYEASQSEMVIITVTDHSINQNITNRHQVDVVSVRVYSTFNNHPFATFVSLRETSPDSGVFQEFILISDDPEAHESRIRVQAGTTISAQYKDLITSAKIVGGPLHFYGGLVHLYQGQWRTDHTIPFKDDMKIFGHIYNRSNKTVSFIAIIQIMDSEGFTTEILTKVGLVGRQAVPLSIPWQPVVADDYEITIFLWSNLKKPIVLADAKTSNVTLIHS